MSSMYGDLARYYDIIYAWKDYAAEARKLEKLIARSKKSKGNDLLEVACGTGAHAAALKKRFTVTAFDINKGMLKVARRKVKGVEFLKADMTEFELGRKFDVIVCLFSSIGYVKTYANLAKTLRNFAAHLKPGGVVIIEPWFTRKVYKAGAPHAGVFGNDEVKIARVTVSKVRGLLSVMDMHYLIAKRGQEAKHYIDHHELALFEPKKFLDYMKRAGLSAKFLKSDLTQDRGLYVGVKV